MSFTPPITGASRKVVGNTTRSFLEASAKNLTRFENSAQNLMYDEPDKTNQELIRIAHEILNPIRQHDEIVTRLMLAELSSVSNVKGNA